VPPVPWRRLAIAAAVLVVALTAAGLYAIPRIESSKERGSEREREELARRQAAERRRVIAEQRPRRGSVRRPPGRLSAGTERRARRRLLAAVELAITEDVGRRVARRELRGTASRTVCQPAPSSVEREGGERDLRLRRDGYDCLAVTREIRRAGVRTGSLGHPFRAVVDFRRFTFAWCKTNPVPGERAIPDPRKVPRLPRACSGPSR
jgi:hypothetical protein